MSDPLTHIIHPVDQQANTRTTGFIPYSKFAIFIDAGYLNAILKSKFNKQKIDYKELQETIGRITNAVHLRSYYYFCYPIVREKNQQDVAMLQNTQRFISELQRVPRFEVREGKLQFANGQFKQKMVDVLLSIDIVEMTARGIIDTVFVIAGDSDFVPAIQKAKNTGALVHLLYHPSSVHTQLLNTIDEAHIITEELMNTIIKKEIKRA